MSLASRLVWGSALLATLMPLSINSHIPKEIGNTLLASTRSPLASAEPAKPVRSQQWPITFSYALDTNNNGMYDLGEPLIKNNTNTFGNNTLIFFHAPRQALMEGTTMHVQIVRVHDAHLFMNGAFYLPEERKQFPPEASSFEFMRFSVSSYTQEMRKRGVDLRGLESVGYYLTISVDTRLAASRTFFVNYAEPVSVPLKQHKSLNLTTDK